MLDTLKTVKKFRNLYNLGSVLASGYYEFQTLIWTMALYFPLLDLMKWKVCGLELEEGLFLVRTIKRDLKVLALMDSEISDLNLGYLVNG